jgi:hypothetical protein
MADMDKYHTIHMAIEKAIMKSLKELKTLKSVTLDGMTFREYVDGLNEMFCITPREEIKEVLLTTAHGIILVKPGDVKGMVIEEEEWQLK